MNLRWSREQRRFAKAAEQAIRANEADPGSSRVRVRRRYGSTCWDKIGVDHTADQRVSAEVARFRGSPISRTWKAAAPRGRSAQQRGAADIGSTCSRSADVRRCWRRYRQILARTDGKQYESSGSSEGQRRLSADSEPVSDDWKARTTTAAARMVTLRKVAGSRNDVAANHQAKGCNARALSTSRDGVAT